MIGLSGSTTGAGAGGVVAEVVRDEADVADGRPAKGQGEQPWRPGERPREELHDVVAAAGGWTPPEHVHHEVERHSAEDGGGKAASGNRPPRSAAVARAATVLRARRGSAT